LRSISDPTVGRLGIFKRLSRLNSGKVRQLYKRLQGWFLRWRTPHPISKKFPVFIVGSNRSGTQMVCGAIGKSLHGWDYQENEANIAFKDFQLRADWIIKSLIRFSPAPIISFGNILDSQFADQLLSRFEGSKAIWVYRRYEDAANSSVHKWNNHFKDDIIRWVALGELGKLGARGNRISSSTENQIRNLYREDISNEDGACLYWFMRNRLYFDLNLHNDPRVLIVQYEHTVFNKEEAFQRIFDFLGCPYDPAIIDGIFASSVAKHKWPGIDPLIQELCDDLKAQLDLQFERTLN
jgi:hypothetical protein